MTTYSQRVRKALRFLRVPLVVTAFGVVGVVLRPAGDDTLATQAQKRAALGKIRCPGGGYCFGLLSPPVGQCTALASCDGCDPNGEAQGCPGDSGYVAPAAGARLRRLLHCAKREGALHTWHSDPVIPGNPCSVSLMFTRAEARAWVERLDAAASTAMVDEHIAGRPAHAKNGAGRTHTWAGVPPDDTVDALVDGGVLDTEALEPEDAGP